MGIGAILGGGVDAYQNAAQIARTQAWEDEQRAELRRQRDQDIARDAAGKAGQQDAQTAAQDTGDQVVDGSAIGKMAPGLDPNNAANVAAFIKNNPGVDSTAVIKGLATSGAGVRPTAPDANPSQPDAPQVQGIPIKPIQGPAPADPMWNDPTAPGPQGLNLNTVDPKVAAALQRANPAAFQKGVSQYNQTSGTVSIPGEAPATPNAPMRDTSLDNLRTYMGADGQVHMTTKTARDAKPSEVLGATAKRYLSLGDAKSMDMGTKLMKMAGETMAQENQQEVNAVMSDKSLDVAGKMGKLAGMIGDNSFIPGETKLVAKPDGSGIMLQTQVPGQSSPHYMPIKGATPEEALQNLALTVQSMHNPDIAMKLQDHNLKATEAANTKDYHDKYIGALADKTDMLGQHYLQQAQWMGEKNQLISERDAARTAKMSPAEVLEEKATGLAKALQGGAEPGQELTDAQAKRRAYQILTKDPDAKPAPDLDPQKKLALTQYYKYLTDNQPGPGAARKQAELLGLSPEDISGGKPVANPIANAFGPSKAAPAAAPSGIPSAKTLPNPIQQGIPTTPPRMVDVTQMTEQGLARQKADAAPAAAAKIPALQAKVAQLQAYYASQPASAKPILGSQLGIAMQELAEAKAAAGQ